MVNSETEWYQADAFPFLRQTHLHYMQASTDRYQMDDRLAWSNALNSAPNQKQPVHSHEQSLLETRADDLKNSTHYAIQS